MPIYLLDCHLNNEAGIEASRATPIEFIKYIEAIFSSIDFGFDVHCTVSIVKCTSRCVVTMANITTVNNFTAQLNERQRNKNNPIA